MSDLYSISLDAENNMVNIGGKLTYATVKDISLQTDALFAPLKSLNIDLNGVTRGDSAGLALFIHWIRAAKQNKKTLVFHNIPKQMLAIAEASSVDELLP